MAKKQIATFLGPNQGLSILGSHAYAFSGNLTITGQGTGDPDTVLLKFHTGKQFIDIDLTIGLDTSADLTVAYEINLNGQTVYAVKWDAGGPSGFIVDVPVKLIIPPLTEFELKVGTDANKLMCAILRGRVYDA